MIANYLQVVSDLQAAQPVEYRKFGIVGDGKHFDDKGVVDLIHAAGSYGRVEMQGNPAILLGDTVKLTDMDGVTLTTGRVPDTTRHDVARTPYFLWDGAKGGDMLVLDRCKNMVLDGFVFETDAHNRDRAPAGRAIVMDGDEHTEPYIQGAFGTTCTISRCRHWTNPDQAGLSPNDVAADFISISPTAKDNQEFHEIVECGGNGNSRGRFLVIGASYNPKAIKLYRSRNIDRYDRAVQVDGGFVQLEYNNMTGNEWDLWLSTSAVGIVTEVGHIGESSRHHAMVSMPYVSWASTFEHSATRKRSVLIPNPIYPPNVPEGQRDIEECWILFASHCDQAAITHCTLSSMRDPDTKFFGFMDAANFGHVEIGPNYLGQHHTMRTLGLDRDTLAKLRGTWKILFHNRATDGNPAGPGVLDLPTGEFAFNDRGVVHSRAPQLTPIAPSVVNAAVGPVAWSTIAPGTAIDFVDPATHLTWRQAKAADGSTSMGLIANMRPA